MTDRNSTLMSASDAARIAADHPEGGKYRRAGEPVLGATGHAGRHVDADSIHGLVLDAFAAAELLAQQSDSWGPEQILLHPELAKLALAEAGRDQAGRGGRGGRMRRRGRAGADQAGPLTQALDLLTQAHTRISFVDA